MSEEKITFKNLESLRRLSNLSVDELMKQIGRHRVTYYTWQQSGTIPSADVIKLHEFFNVSTDLLLDVKPLVFSELVQQ